MQPACCVSLLEKLEKHKRTIISDERTYNWRSTPEDWAESPSAPTTKGIPHPEIAEYKEKPPGLLRHENIFCWMFLVAHYFRSAQPPFIAGQWFKTVAVGIGGWYFGKFYKWLSHSEYALRVPLTSEEREHYPYPNLVSMNSHWPLPQYISEKKLFDYFTKYEPLDFTVQEYTAFGEWLKKAKRDVYGDKALFGRMKDYEWTGVGQWYTPKLMDTDHPSKTPFDEELKKWGLDPMSHPRNDYPEDDDE
jgi:hypothetical protein